MASKHWTRRLLTTPHRPPQKDKTNAVIATKAAEIQKRSGVPTGPMRHQ
jgi:hypothetical protein